MSNDARPLSLEFRFLSNNHGVIEWMWDEQVSSKIYHVTWKPKHKDITFLTLGLDDDAQHELRNEIIHDLQAEVDPFTKKRKTK